MEEEEIRKWEKVKEILKRRCERSEGNAEAEEDGAPRGKGPRKACFTPDTSSLWRLGLVFSVGLARFLSVYISPSWASEGSRASLGYEVRSRISQGIVPGKLTTRGERIQDAEERVS